MRWTEDQQKIIDIRDKNILVSAAAGSGKTAVLVERIKNLIIKDRVPLKSMLVVTFTNAAAGEMKQRIIDAVNKELKTNDDDFLREQIQNIYNTHISTFHAFAISILKRYYHVVGIEPSFNICTENRLELYKNEAIDILLKEEFEKRSPEFIKFMNDYATSKSEDAVTAMILATYDFIQTIPDPEKWLKNSIEALNGSSESFEDGPVFAALRSQISHNLDRALAKNENLTELLNDGGVVSLAKKAEADSQNIRTLIRSFKNDRFEIFLSSSKDFSMQRFSVSKEEKEAYEEIRDKVDKIRKAVKSYINYIRILFPDYTVSSRITEINDTFPSAKVLGYLVGRFSGIFSKIKEREEVLDFGDVEHLALKVLSHDDVAEEYRSKFRYIFIDEYQDSNYIQEALIDRIKRKDNLFMVGDVKQSIYKFRRAEPGIFLSRYEEYGPEGKDDSCRIDLNKNFRSKKNIIECINDTFANIMEQTLSGMDYDENAFLYQGLDYEAKWDVPVDFYVIDSSKADLYQQGQNIETEEADERINEIAEAELEAHKIAEIIKAEVGRSVFDVKKGKERSLEYRDIVILLRTVKSNASVIYEALMDHGIPTFADGGEDYFSTVEIETFLNLLKVIDNKRQDIPLVSAMRSPVFGFTTEELIKIRLTKKTGNYYSAFLSYMEDGLDEILQNKIVNMNDRLEKWGLDENFMALDDFLWMLMEESGYYNYAGALVGGEQRRANLRALIDRASDYSTGKIRGLYGFIKYIDIISKNNIKMGQIKLLSENDNVVRITSVHKSKGLEYPYVILARLGKKFNKNANTSKIRLDKELGLALQWENYDLHAFKKTLLTRITNEKREIEELAEEIRILYVAMTRAMDKLILIGAVDSKENDLSDILSEYAAIDISAEFDIKSANSYLNLLLPLTEKAGLQPVPVLRQDLDCGVDMDKGGVDSTGNIKSRLEKLTGDLIKTDTDQEEAEKIDKRLSFTYPHENALSLKSKYSVTQLNNIGKEPEKIMTFGLGEDRMSELIPEFMEGDTGLSSAERGTVLHTVFEKLDFKEALAKKGDPDYIEDFLDEMVSRELMTGKERSSVDKYAVSTFINSQIMKRAANSNHVYKERPFNLIKEKDGETIIVQGIIDCYFEEEGKYVLLDYKSNYVKKDDPSEIERLSSMYEKQINLYRDALETITGKEVKEAFLFLTGIGETVEISKTPNSH